MSEKSLYGILSDLTKASGMPMDLVNHHVTKLTESVGLATGSTIPDLSEKQLGELASDASKPQEFIDKYRHAESQNTKNLAPMMTILHGLAADPETRSYFGGKRSSTSGSSSLPDDYHALKEKLLQQVAPYGVLEESSPPRPKRLFTERPFLTLDFLPADLSVVGAEKSSVLGTLGKIPVSSQESAIIEDLLYCLIGIEGTHIKPVIDQGNTLTRRSHRPAESGLSFQVDETLDPSLKELLGRITPLCDYYSNVVKFAESNEQMDVGRVNQALSGAIYHLLKDYYIFVTQLETQHRQGDLTLNKIWFYIQPTMQVLLMVSETCSRINKVSARGGRTLSLLHQQFTNQSGNETCRSVAEYLVQTSAKPYFEILNMWLHRGLISDAGDDFFVGDNELGDDLALLPAEYSDDYWERRYSIRAEQIPSFLHNYSDMILRTGKYLNVIQQCDKSIKWPDSVEDLVYLANPEHYVHPLEKAYVFASKTLLDLLVKDRDLIGHLRSVKHYFLLDQGDFIVQFLDLCEHELLQSVNRVEPARLETLLELAQRTSAANTDPYKDNVAVELLPYDLIFQMSKILSIDTEDESDFRSPTSNELTGLEAFAFGYRVQWPISLVLNRKSLACYQMLLRHLLYCKHVERQICRAWISTKNAKSSHSPGYALRIKMLNFLQNLEYYMTFEVLEPNWEGMIGKIRSGKVANVDQVLEIHSDFLSTCMNDCMLSSPALLTTVKRLLGVCSDFAAYLEAVDDADNNNEGDADFAENVERFDGEFTAVLVSLLDRIAQIGRDNYNERILNMLNRLDFNGFYSKVQEKISEERNNEKVPVEV